MSKRPARLLVLPRAEIDVLDIALYLVEESLNTTERFEAAVVDTSLDLCHYPESNPVIEAEGLTGLGLRRAIVQGFPNHLLIYDFDGSTVRILRAFHASQDWTRELFQ